MKLSNRALAVIDNSMPKGIQSHDGLALPESVIEVNRWLVPSALSRDTLGDKNSIDRGILDNRHISNDLKVALCESSETRSYFETLIELAWRSDTEFHLCCGDHATACFDPDFVFSSKANDDSTLPPPAFAPHFLTKLFGPGQQETLTAALIAKLNTRGESLLMEVAGRFDLGADGVILEPRKEYEDFPYELGRAWGNMFLDCIEGDGNNGTDAGHVLCEASLEIDRTIGRNSLYHPYPMFTCSGSDSDQYPIEEAGESCFSQDMETNNKDGCGLVAAVGPCDKVCVNGFCGVNQPPLVGRGTINVMHVYVNEFDDQDDKIGLKVVLPVIVALILLLMGAAVFRARAKQPTPNRGSVAPLHHKDERTKNTGDTGDQRETANNP